MEKRLYIKLLLGFSVYLLTGCAVSPTYVNDADAKAKDKNNGVGLNEVHFKIEKAFEDSPPSCIAVMPFQKPKIGSASVMTKVKNEFTSLKLNKAAMANLRRALYSNLAPYFYRDVELDKVDNVLKQYAGKQIDYAQVGEKLKCDAILIGEVTDYQSNFFGVYSQLSIGVKLKLLRAKNGELLWHGEHVATSRGGDMPLTPISIVLGLFDATANVSKEQQLRVENDLFRRLLTTWSDIKPKQAADIQIAEEAPAEKNIVKQQTYPFRISSYQLYLRSGPGRNFEPKAVLDQDAKLALLDSKFSPWVQVKVANGQLGYVNKKYITLAQ